MIKGIVRKLDELGRISIPIEFRRTTGVMNGDKLSLHLTDGVIRLSKGEGRKLDPLGRYTIPKEIRNTNGWKIRQPLDIYLEGNEICIQPYGCEWCDETENLTEITSHRLCQKCVKKVTETMEKEMNQ